MVNGALRSLLVVSSDVANAGFRVAGSFGKLWDSDYGDLLLKKIATVAAMLALAYLNRFVLVPRLRAAEPKQRSVRWPEKAPFEIIFPIVTGYHEQGGGFIGCRRRCGSPATS